MYLVGCVQPCNEHICYERTSLVSSKNEIYHCSKSHLSTFLEWLRDDPSDQPLILVFFIFFSLLLDAAQYDEANNSSFVSFLAGRLLFLELNNIALCFCISFNNTH